MRTRRLAIAALLALGAGLLTACGDDDAADPDEEGIETPDPTDGPDADGPDDGDGTVPSGPTGSGSAVIGEATFTFEVIHCGSGPEETGNEDVLFSLSGQGEDGLTVDASRQVGFGPGAERDPDADPVDGITILQGDLSDPDVLWEAFGLEPFLEIDGERVTATTEFSDETADGFDPVVGTFEATCP